jgi:hypothetical protein
LYSYDSPLADKPLVICLAKGKKRQGLFLLFSTQRRLKIDEARQGNADIPSVRQEGLTHLMLIFKEYKFSQR